MIDPVLPKYDWGQRVRPHLDLLSDGSFPEHPEGAVLVEAGTAGEIVRVGMHAEFNLPVYLVEFATDRVVGCFEHEIEPANNSAPALQDVP